MEWNRYETRRRLEPGHFALRAGTMAKVRHCASSYPLPDGLQPGDAVKILGFQAGYYTVEKSPRRFFVFLTNVVAEPTAAPLKSSATAAEFR